MKAAECRGRERQRIEERKIEKERQKEGDEFKDKPEFVTSAYRKRMQEREAEEEEERRKAAIEGYLFFVGSFSVLLQNIVAGLQYNDHSRLQKSDFI